MSAITIQNIAIWVGAVATSVAALCGAAWKYYAPDANRERAEIAFKESLHFHSIEGHWVEIGSDIYQLGVVATVLNEDGNRAVRFDGLKFDGTISIAFGGTGSATYKSIKIYEGPVTNLGDYFIPPGDDADFYILWPSEVEMTIQGGVPAFNLIGNWSFVFKDVEFPIDTPAISMQAVSTLADWEAAVAEN